MAGIQRDPLFVAATRPALFLGLPLEMAVAIVMIGALVVIFGHNPFYLALLLPLWFGARWLVRYDYNAPRVAWLWFRTKATGAGENRVWGGSSPSPFPVKSRAGRGMRNAE